MNLDAENTIVGGTNNVEDRFVCADCGAVLPEWASINRGVLICSECCSVHRRHVSQVRSLKKGAWHGSQYELVQTLYASGANSVWEHALLDAASSGTHKHKKKPVSNDPIIPKKESFIKSKYAQLAYAIRPPKDEQLTLEDLNRQLWCCVRTSHVETTLRLLAMGADPNYADASGNTPLHVAAKENQHLQVELIWLYGADVARQNADNFTPAQLAREHQFFDLAARLDSLEFEITDRFSLFLCGLTPNHTAQQHFLVPELAVGPGADRHVRPFRALLQRSAGTVFERLIQDVYDEVDRREVCIQWNAAEHYRLANHQHIAVFLPPIQNLSATRNQLRQKLAKFDLHEFFQLLIDLLREIHRRYHGLPLPPEDTVITQKFDKLSKYIDADSSVNKRDTNIEHKADLTKSPVNMSREMDESRDYDEVADLFSGSKPQFSNGKKRSSEPALQHRIISDEINNGTPQTDSATRVNDNNSGNEINSSTVLDNYLELKERLAYTNEKLDTVLNTNAQLLGSFNIVQNLVNRLQSEQSDLRARLDSFTRFSESRNTAHRNVASPPPANLRCKSPADTQASNSLGGSKARENMQYDNFLLSKSITNASRQQPPRHYRQHSLNTPLHVNALGFSASASSAHFPTNPMASGSGAQLARNASGGALLTRHDREIVSPLAYRDDPHRITSGEDTENRNRKKSGDSTITERIVREYKYSYQQSKTASSGAQTPTPGHNVVPSLQNMSRLKELFDDGVFPDNLILETELLTGAIKNLLNDLQQQNSADGDGGVKDANALFHSDSIGHHISRIAHHIIPASRTGQSAVVQRCIGALDSAMSVLSRKCNAHPLNADDTVQAAFDVAKNAKQLLVTVHDQDSNQFT